MRGDIAGSGTFTLCRGDLLAPDAVPGLPGRRALHPPTWRPEFAARKAFVRGVHRREPRARKPRPGDHPIPLCRCVAESIAATRGVTVMPRRRTSTVRPSGPTIRPNTSTLFSLSGIRVGNDRRSTHSAISPGFMNPCIRTAAQLGHRRGRRHLNGAGDRGDAAMIGLVGGTRYALARATGRPAGGCAGRCRVVLESPPPPAWRRTASWLPTPTNWRGVSTGDANLCTSNAYYDALLSAVPFRPRAGRGIRQDRPLCRIAGRGVARAIDAHFGGEVGGYDTYRYYTGNTLLRFVDLHAADRG